MLQQESLGRGWLSSGAGHRQGWGGEEWATSAPYTQTPHPNPLSVCPLRWRTRQATAVRHAAVCLLLLTTTGRLQGGKKQMTQASLQIQLSSKEWVKAKACLNRWQKQKAYLCFLALDTFWTFPAAGKILINNTLTGHLQYTRGINIVHITANSIQTRCGTDVPLYILDEWSERIRSIPWAFGRTRSLLTPDSLLCIWHILQ